MEAGLLRVLVIDERLVERAMKSMVGTEAEHPDVARTLIPVSEKNPDSFDPQCPRFWHAAERAGVLLVTHLDLDPVPALPEREKWKDPELFTWTLDKDAFEAAGKERDDWDTNPSHLLPTCPSLRLVVHPPWKSTKKNGSRDEKPQVALICNRRGKGKGGREENLRDECNDVNLVLVHQGVLDTLASKADRNIADGFVEALKSSFDWYVVESGRGVPPNVQETHEKFLPFSLLDRTLTAGRVAKLRLARMLMELTRRQDHG